MYNWTTPIRYVRGLGPTKARELNKIGIDTVGDLLEYQPLHYIYPGGVTIAEAKEGHVVIKAKIESIKWVGFHISTRMVATLNDGTGTCKAEWYNARYVSQQLRSGMTVTFWGRYKGGVLQQPKWTTVESSMADVYGGQYGVHHQTIRAALVEVFRDLSLPQMYGGLSRIICFQEYHFPYDKHEQQLAAYGLKFDECLQLQLALAERRQGQRRCIKAVAYMVDGVKQDVTIMSYFPYAFTGDQYTAVSDIIADMQKGIPMQRLIHGEVGSGKTAVAFYATMLAALNGKRTLILCPTTILAQQHYDTLKGMGWNDVNLCTSANKECGVLVAGKNFADTQTASIIIGTHALLHSNPLLKSASLVIIDEFQKFGVAQRAKIQKYNPHLLMLSATPIPRTLAATVFGDLDVSTIRQLPISRGQVITRWVLPDRRDAMYEIVERELAKGHQAYIIYPRISGDEDILSAERGLKEWSYRYDNNDSEFDASDIALLTGRTSAENKQDIFRQFKEGHIRVLISTVIAEVGLDVPNANVMVIEGADRFGLSTLHQLRGRVCRSTDAAFCFLVSETANPTSIDRLQVIERCNDGFEIAEADLRLRGPGEVFSTRQHGLPDLKFVSLIDDFDLMIEARDLVQSGSVGGGVCEMMEIKYGDNLSLGEVV